MTSFCSDRLLGFQHGLGLVDEELAARLGVAPETAHAWTSGPAVPDDVPAVAAALGVDVEDLAPTGHGAGWDYVSAIARCADPDSDAVFRSLARLLAATPQAVEAVAAVEVVEAVAA